MPMFNNIGCNTNNDNNNNKYNNHKIKSALNSVNNNKNKNKIDLGFEGHDGDADNDEYQWIILKRNPRVIGSSSISQENNELLTKVLTVLKNIQLVTKEVAEIEEKVRKLAKSVALVSVTLMGDKINPEEKNKKVKEIEHIDHHESVGRENGGSNSRAIKFKNFYNDPAKRGEKWQ